MPVVGLGDTAVTLIVVTIVAALHSLIALAVRIYLRLNINGPFGWDDGACVLATILGIIDSILTLVEIPFGLGAHEATLSTTQIEWSQFLLWLTNLLYTVALAFSILSICFLLVRLMGPLRKVWIAHTVGVAIVLWGFISIFVYAFSCELPYPWRITKPRHCIGLWAMYASIEATKTALEIALILTSVALIWSLQMPLKPRLTVVAAFTLRLLIVPCSILRLRYSHLALFSEDWSYSRAKVVITTQVVLHLSIILATIPCAKPFLSVLHRSSVRMRGHASNLSGRPVSQQHRSAPTRPASRLNMAETVTSIHHDPADARTAARRRSIESSLSSAKSKEAIMRTDTFQVEVEHGDAQAGSSRDLGMP